MRDFNLGEHYPGGQYTMASQTEALSISNVVTNTLGVISRNPVIFLGLSLVVVGIPQLLIGLFSGGLETTSDMMALAANPALIVGGLVSYIAFILLSIVLQAALIVATANDLGGKPVNFADCVNRAIGKLLPLIGLGIVMTIGLGIGFVLLIIPGIILYLMWMIAVPVVMVENKGVFEALSRSRELTSGSRWKLLGMIIVFIVFAIIVAIPFGIFALISPSLALIGNALAAAVTSAVSSAGIAAIYLELRNNKEGTDTSTLADVFA